MPRDLKPIPYTSSDGAEQLLKLFKQFDPEGKVKKENRGYHFAFSKVFLGERTVKLLDNRYFGKPYNVVEKEIQGKIKQKKFENEKDEIDGLKVLASEYKIHIMPKPEYILPIVAIFLEACKSDPKITSLIYSFKIRQNPFPSDLTSKEVPSNRILPHMVIYLDLTQGKEAANKVLKCVYEIFSDIDTYKVGMNELMPRFSLVINQLLSYSQGGGDVKNDMSGSQLENYLSQNQVHYNFLDQHLENPIIPDLENFKSIFSNLAIIKLFKFEKIGFQLHSSVCALPHLYVFLGFKIDKGNPILFAPSETDQNLVKTLYAKVLKPFGIPCPKIVWAGKGFYLNVYLPGEISIIRTPKFKKEFLTLLYTTFLEPYDFDPLLSELEEENDLESLEPPAKRRKTESKENKEEIERNNHQLEVKKQAESKEKSAEALMLESADKTQKVLTSVGPIKIDFELETKAQYDLEVMSQPKKVERKKMINKTKDKTFVPYHMITRQHALKKSAGSDQAKTLGKASQPERKAVKRKRSDT